MSRPKPTVGSPNNHAAFFRQALVFASRFAAHEGVVGVLLTGGVARGYADHFSEIDLAVYLTRSTFERWTQTGLAPCAEGDLPAAHHCLNTTLDSLIRAVFLVNDELIPFNKWALNLTYTLAWTPSDWRRRVEQALLVREYSQTDVEQRCTLIHALLAECRAKLFGPRREGLETIEARKLEMLHVIREHGAMLASEFDRRFGLRRAVQSPLFHLLRRETRSHEEWLVFDEERLRDYTERGWEDFLAWDRALLRILAEGAER